MSRMTCPALALALALISSCGGEGVTFVIEVETGLFLQSTGLTVTIWDEELNAISERQAGCMVRHDQETGEDTVSCPEGVEYQEVEPEKHSADLAEELEVESTSVSFLETYRVLISGSSEDGCNSTRADPEGRALSDRVELRGLSWGTTAMGCP